MRTLFVASIVAALVVACCTTPAAAIPKFQKVFIAEYIDDHEDAEFAEFMKKKAKCHICHQGKKKKHHNAYGEHLEDLLDKKADKDDDDKIIAALQQVADLPFDPEDENSETYGERIAASKLPAADDLEDLKAEPEGGEEAEE